MTNKTILFDGRFLSLENAGLGRYTSELLKKLLPLDEEQRYILVVSGQAKFDEELSRVLSERKNPVEIIETDAGHYSLAEQTKFLSLIKSLKPDLVHFPHFNHPLLYNGKFVVTIHDLTLSHFMDRGSFIKKNAYNMIINHAAKSSQKILTVSQFVKAELVKEFTLPVSKVVVTYNGLDNGFKKITNPKTLERAEKYGLDKPYLLYIGQWRTHKNLLRLVEAFKEIQAHHQYKDKLDLVFTGKPDARYPQLKEKITAEGMQDHVKFTGFVADEDLPVLLNNARAFVFPSLSEGFGLPPLEAQACGVPVAASNKTCLPEILGEGALYFNPVNVPDMERKILRVLEDDELRADLVKLGLENAKKFNWEAAAQKTLEVYREILYK